MIKKVQKRIILFCLVVSVLLGQKGQIVRAELQGPDVFGEGYCVLDWETGDVILSKNKDEKMYPASITKVLTALVVLEHVDDLDKKITFSKYAIDSLTSNSSTLVPVAQVGEVMTIRDVLHGMLLVSANECSTALAEYVAGSEEAFAKLMNEKAAEIGAKNSHFVNAHGLHEEDHYTTPYDIALIFSAALRDERFLAIEKTIDYVIPATNKSEARKLHMGHAMVNGDEECEGVFAGKTGRTLYAGRTLLTACTREGHTAIVSLMKSDDYKCYIDTRIILEYAFGQMNHTMETPFQWHEKEEQVWAKANVTIREFPSVHAISKGVLEEGHSLIRLGTYEGWSMVKCNSGNYYIGSSFLTTENPEESQTGSSGPTEDTEETESPVSSQSEGNELSQSTEEMGSSQNGEGTDPSQSTDITEPEGASSDSDIPSSEEKTTPAGAAADDPNQGPKNDTWQRFWQHKWAYLAEAVVLVVVLGACVVKLAHKTSHGHGKIDRKKYRNKKTKW